MKSLWIMFLSLLPLGLTGCPSEHGQVEHANVAFDVSPDGNQIVFSSADGDLYLFHLKTSRVIQLTATPTKEFTPAISPDGNSVAYAASTEEDEGTHIFVRSLDGKHVEQLTSNKEVSDSMPCYSADGSEIVFARAHRHRPYSLGGWTWDNYDAYVMNSDGTNLRRITHQNYYQLIRPKFLVQGKTLIYAATGPYPDTVYDLFTADIAAGRPKALTVDRNKTVEYVAFLRHRSRCCQ